MDSLPTRDSRPDPNMSFIQRLNVIVQTNELHKIHMCVCVCVKKEGGREGGRERL